MLYVVVDIVVVVVVFSVYVWTLRNLILKNLFSPEIRTEILKETSEMLNFGHNFNDAATPMQNT
jgi:hypothetical protein